MKNHQFRNQHLHLLAAFMAFFGLSGFWRQKNVDDYTFRKSFSSKTLSMETLLKESNHVVIRKSNLELSSNQNLNLSMFSNFLVEILHQKIYFFVLWVKTFQTLSKKFSAAGLSKLHSTCPRDHLEIEKRELVHSELRNHRRKKATYWWNDFRFVMYITAEKCCFTHGIAPPICRLPDRGESALRYRYYTRFQKCRL